MKKRNLFLIMALTITALCAGCGEKEVEPPTHEKISISISTTVKQPTAMTKAELASLTAPQIQEMVEAYLPNYRAIYGIEEGHEMTDEDYLELRDKIMVQLYGEEEVVVADVDVSEIDFKNPSEIVGKDGSYLDPGWIFYAPCKEYIDTLSDKAFISYLEGLMDYWGRDMSGVDLNAISPKDLDLMRVKVIEEFCQPWGSAYIPTVNELAEQGKDSYLKEDVEENASQTVEAAESGDGESGENTENPADTAETVE